MNFISPYYRARFLMLGAGIVCFVLFWLGGKVFGIPAMRGYQASLTLQPSPVTALVIVVVGIGACAAIGTVIAGRIRFNAGLLSAALGLAALSVSGGSSRGTIHLAMDTFGSEKAMLVRMIVELVVLSAAMGACWWVLRKLYKTGTLKDRESEHHAATPAKEQADEAMAFGMQLVVTALGIMILAPTDAKQQVMAAVFIAAFGGSAATHSTFQTRPRSWYWLPPLLVGIGGYAWAWFSPPAGFANANIQDGLAAALVRPLPVDYASMGVAGSVVGHWMSRRWQKDREAIKAWETQQRQQQMSHAPRG